MGLFSHLVCRRVDVNERTVTKRGITFGHSMIRCINVYFLSVFLD